MSRKQTVTAAEIRSVKGRGFLHNKGTDAFSARVITGNGQLTAEQLAVIAEAATRFGNGTVAFTVRLTVEVPGIRFTDIDAFTEFIASAGLKPGGTGHRVRPIVACKGTTCNYGLSDTQGIATLIHERFYEAYYHVGLPHKFKIAIGGCPNNCVKPDLNDLGIISQLVPQYTPEDCRNCAKCAVVDTCAKMTGAASIQNDCISIDRSLCINCGRCVSKCAYRIFTDSQYRFRVFVGGKWGTRPRLGSPLGQLLDETEMLNVIEKAILLYRQQGLPEERFGDMIDRLGVEKSEELLLSDELLQQKDEILS